MHTLKVTKESLMCINVLKSIFCLDHSVFLKVYLFESNDLCCSMTTVPNYFKANYVTFNRICRKRMQNYYNISKMNKIN